MDIFKKIKDFSKQIREVENNLYAGKQDFLEIYERNVELEKEIEERTKELDLANQRMLTIQHIWEMMNSSKPLSSVLETTVNTLQGELGYLHSSIIRKDENEDGNSLKMIACSNDETIEAANNYLDFPVNTLKLTYNKNGMISKALKTKEIVQSINLREGLTNILPNLSEETLEKILSTTKCRSFMLIPLMNMQTPFGALLVLSSREDVTEGELDFLTLFAQQIELAITIADLFQMVKEQAITDGLTGLFNRRYFEEHLNKEFIRAKRQKQPFTIIGLDLDHLKQINDTFGHTCGDLAIKQIADILKQNARSIDIAARMGGEEFNLLLPGIDSKGGQIAAERLRQAIESSPINTVGKITASLGVATFLEHSTDIEELLELVDQSMYQSKRNGRNQVTVAKPISETPWQEIAVNAFIDILSKKRIPIEENLSSELCEKLEEKAKSTETPQDLLYNVSDMLSQIYNPQHQFGNTKTKIEIAIKLGEEMNLELEEINKLKIAMLLYDIGNLMLPKELLNKQEPLTDDELSFIKKHPIIAAREILEPISTVQNIIPIIEKHHENWDGSGYPNKLTGNEIPITSQIVLILDSYFAMIEQRPYRQALTKHEALEIIRQDANKKWNEQLVTAFISIVK